MTSERAGPGPDENTGRGVLADPMPGGAVSRVPLLALCVTEITSWGVLYYAFPVLAPAITRDTGWSTGSITAAFSAGLVVAAIGGVPLGRVLDRHGPRIPMTAGSAAAVLGVLGLAAAPGLAWFVAAWLLAGAAMAAVLYPPAFAALTRYYAPRHVRALTTLTLVAGLASTVFAPLTSALAAHMSWRAVYLVLAALLAATVPLHHFALRRPWPPAAGRRPADNAARDNAARDGTARDAAPGRRKAVVRGSPFLLLTTALTLWSFSMYAVVTNLIPLLTSRGASSAVAAWALGLGGVGQVAGRLGYGALTRRTGVRSRTVCILAGSAVTIAMLAALPGPVPLLVAVAVLVGAMRGIATLLQATAVSDRWGTAAYGSLSGILAAPVTIAGAIAPAAGAGLAAALGGYPAMFAALAAIAALAAAVASGSVPRHAAAPGSPANVSVCDDVS
ncbi:MFS transporter [Actinomadura sp. NPDC000600]|uniref:MFS transporter n=1 Tax=Actinomadura sp. NPDC000600 TaxID=3154262 RepID=UPI00339A10D1